MLRNEAGESKITCTFIVIFNMIQYKTAFLHVGCAFEKLSRQHCQYVTTYLIRLLIILIKIIE